MHADVPLYPSFSFKSGGREEEKGGLEDLKLSWRADEKRTSHLFPTITREFVSTSEPRKVPGHAFHIA